MKIALTSDHHHHPYPAFASTLANGMNSRVAEMLAVERSLQQIMQTQGVVVHLRGGDLYDRKNQIDAVVWSEVAHVLEENGKLGIEEVILKGNHDLAAGGVRNSLEALAILKNVRVIPMAQQIAFGSTMVTFVPYDDDPAIQRQWIDDVVLPQQQFNMLLAHVQIRGAKSGSEYVMPGNLGTDDLRLDDFDRVWCGHVHEPQVLTKTCEYIGSLTQRAFTDEGRRRRVVIFDTEKMSHEEIALPGPLFVTLKIDSLEELQAVAVGADTYYHLKVCSDAIKLRAVDAKFDGQCLGWTTTFEVAGPVTAPRLSPTLTKWPDIIAAYVQQGETTLDKARLLTVGLGIAGETSGTA